MKYALDFSFAYGQPSARADYRCEPSDFVVNENLGFEPEGVGEHIYLYVKKTDNNTTWLAARIAKYFNVKKMDVGYCGLKDRHAITQQWFSVYAPKYDHTSFCEQHLHGALERCEVLVVKLGRRKLKRGQHLSNHFMITLKKVHATEGDLENRLNMISTIGVPNYFGEQRFGHNGANLSLVQQWLDNIEKGRFSQPRDIVMSAARSYLFNKVLSYRVGNNNWTELLSGDQEQCPTGPLWGRGNSLALEQTLQLEQDVLQTYSPWLYALEHCGLQQQRRSLILKPQNFSWQIKKDQVQLSFSLNPGEYATSVLRELAILTNRSINN